MVLTAMPAVTYREHLDLFYKYRASDVSPLKILAVLACAVVLSLSSSLYITNLNNKQVIPANKQSLYFESASNSFYKSKQAMDELRASFQVAGAKTVKIDSLKEASASARIPGFFTTLSDIQKTIDFIKLTKSNVEAERNSLESTSPPQLYSELDSQIMEYLKESELLLTKMENDQVALEELIRQTSPTFYLPTLSEENVWETGDIGQIKAYYQKKQEQAKDAYDSFKNLNVSQNLTAYKDLHMSHLLLVMNLSQNIVSTLDRPIAEEEDKKAELVEEAYQILVGATRESEDLSLSMQNERVSLVSLSIYSDELKSLGNRERIITSGLNEF